MSRFESQLQEVISWVRLRSVWNLTKRKKNGKKERTKNHFSIKITKICIIFRIDDARLVVCVVGTNKCSLWTKKNKLAKAKTHPVVDKAVFDLARVQETTSRLLGR